jgi:glycosyltransferase involved in cell wall biosynthesis
VKVLVVSGIWPPDVGGPASHGPEVADFLAGRGHAVEVVVTADAEPPAAGYPIRFVRRSLPPGVRHALGLRLVAERARLADVVYTTGLFGRTSVAAALARTPYVLKLTGDSAYERAYRLGLHRGTLEEFQSDRSLRTLPLRAERSSHARRAAHVVCPSAYLRDLVVGWGVPAGRVSVLPNPVPPVPDPPAPPEVSEPAQRDGTTFVFAGRLTAQKALGVAFRAVARVPGAALLVAGEGPDRAELERLAATLDADVRFLGPQPRERVLELFRGADAAVLSSAWENFPHTVVEALAVGTPVVSTAVGGVPEVVRDGENGLLVPVGDEDALAAALQRISGDPALRARLAAAAAPSVERFAPERVYGELERLLAGAAGR